MQFILLERYPHAFSLSVSTHHTSILMLQHHSVALEDFQVWNMSSWGSLLSHPLPCNQVLAFQQTLGVRKHGSGTVKQEPTLESLPMPTCYSEETALSDWKIPTRSWWFLLLELCSGISNLLCVLPLGRCQSSCSQSRRAPCSLGPFIHQAVSLLSDDGEACRHE